MDKLGNLPKLFLTANELLLIALNYIIVVRIVRFDLQFENFLSLGAEAKT